MILENPIVIICLDGCSWHYFYNLKLKHLRKLLKRGMIKKCKSMIPTVTNVNVGSILTGEAPIKHGITGNSFLNKTLSEVYMDSPNFLRCETFFEKHPFRGYKTLLLTVKDKLKRLFSCGVTTAFSVERPAESLLKNTDMKKPPSIFSEASNIWLLELVLKVVDKKLYDIVCVITTDYIFHKYGEESLTIRRYLEAVDEKIGLLDDKGVILGLTADHGMSQKLMKIDVRKIMRDERIKAIVVPTIKDEYIKHHQNIGGSLYLYILDKNDRSRARRVMERVDGVDEVLTKEEAAMKYLLPSDRIGDLLIVGAKDFAFGDIDGENIYEDIKIQTHGSLYESEVPFIVNCKIELPRKLHNMDLLKTVSAFLK